MKKLFFALITMSLSLTSLTACDNTVSPQPSASQKPIIDDKDLISIEGLVEDDAGRPLADVSIIIKDDTKVVADIKSDSKGKFSTKVPKSFGGSYIVEAKKDVADGSLSQTLIVNEGKPVEFKGSNGLKKVLTGKPPVPPA